MSNPLGRFLNRDAQNFTAEIESATSMNNLAPENAESVRNEAVNKVMNEVLNQPADETLNGAAVLRTAEDSEPSETVEAAEIPQTSETIETGEMVSEEFAHERQLARDEGDIIERSEDFVESETLSTETRAIGARTTEDQPAEMETQSTGKHLLDMAPTGAESDTTEAKPATTEVGFNSTGAEPAQVIASGNIASEQDSAAHPSADSLMEHPATEDLTTRPVADDYPVAPEPNKRFLGGERELAKQTMELVEQATSGRGETALVDILKVYEQGAHEMRQDDERVA